MRKTRKRMTDEELAALFRRCETATEAAKELGISRSGAKSLRGRLRLFYDVGEARNGRPPRKGPKQED